MPRQPLSSPNVAVARYTNLNKTQQAHFRALGALAHAQPFDLPLVAALWEMDEAKAKEQAEAFWQLALLEPILETGKKWYKVHPVLHLYIRALLKTSPEAAQVRRRYEIYVVEITERFWSLPPEEWGQLTPYLPHIQTVGASLIEQSHSDNTDKEVLERSQLFAINTSRYLGLRREVRQDEWLEMGVTASHRLQDQKEEARFLNELGLLYNDLGESAKALDFCQQALSLYRSINDRKGEAATFNFLGKLYWSMGNQPKALEYYEQALPIHKTVGNTAGAAFTLSAIGTSYDTLGEKDKALDYYRQALPLFQATNDQRGIAIAINNLGKVYDDLGEKFKALDYYKQALPLLKAIGDRYIEATTCFNIGTAYEEVGQLEEAVRYLSYCVELDEQVQHPDLESDRAYLNELRAKLVQIQSPQ